MWAWDAACTVCDAIPVLPRTTTPVVVVGIRTSIFGRWRANRFFERRVYVSKNPVGLLIVLTMCATATAVACAGSKGTSSDSGSPSPGAGASGGVGTASAGTAGSGGGVSATTPFAPDGPAVYVAKVKNILLGLPPTDDEVTSITADPSKFADLVHSWMSAPQYEEKMLAFFELAFQQTQIDISGFDLMIPKPPGIGHGPVITLLMQNVQESFARTAVEFAKTGRPLNELFTTHQLMMTVPLMELYGLLDEIEIDDAAKYSDAFAKANNDVKLTLEAGGPAIPIAQSIDPTNKNYMHWNVPALTLDTKDGCGNPEFEAPPTATMLHYILYGGVGFLTKPGGTGPSALCAPQFGDVTTSYFSNDDFSAWKMVTIRTPAAGEATTRFYDLPTLHGANELVLNTPRVGFFTTPAFFANWQSNQSNQMRVTANQALIVATSAQYDGTSPTFPKTNPGLDAEHAAPETACFSCHASLDPTRSIFGATYSWSYTPVSTADMSDNPYATQKGLFAFDGVTAECLVDRRFRGAVGSRTPRFSAGWVQKLCYYVNSAALLRKTTRSSNGSLLSFEVVELRLDDSRRSGGLVAVDHQRGTETKSAAEERRNGGGRTSRAPVRRAERATRP